MAIKKHKQDLIDKKKEIKLKEKIKAKEDKEKAKEELKKAVQLAKMNKKQKPIKADNEASGNNNQENDNVVIGVSNIDLCKEILKTGANKGNPCGVKCYENNLCKRHFNLLNQNKIAK
jgi:hypothetical protein